MREIFENDGSAYGYPIVYTAGVGFIGFCEYGRAYIWDGDQYAMQNLMIFYSVVTFIGLIAVFLN